MANKYSSRKKIKLEDYIQLLDRMLEREGFSHAERDEIFNNEDNIELVSSEFHKKTHPLHVFKKLDRKPVEVMYSSSSVEETISDWVEKQDELSHLKEGDRIMITAYGTPGPTGEIISINKECAIIGLDDKFKEDKFDDGILEVELGDIEKIFESKRKKRKKKPTTKKGKEKKFKKVMKEFGKGKLTPYHAKEPLKSKKQNGSSQAHKQALAIAFSEAGLTKESLNEEETNLTPGQKYAVNYLELLGLELVSAPNQLSKGTLEFYDKGTDTKWQISGTGYLRKLTNASWESPKWAMVYSHFLSQSEMGAKKYLQDDEYMEMAEMLSKKIRKSKKPKPEVRSSYVYRAYKTLLDRIKILENPPGFNTGPAVTRKETIEAIKKLYDKFVK